MCQNQVLPSVSHSRATAPGSSTDDAPRSPSQWVNRKKLLHRLLTGRPWFLGSIRVLLASALAAGALFFCDNAVVAQIRYPDTTSVPPNQIDGADAMKEPDAISAAKPRVPSRAPDKPSASSSQLDQTGAENETRVIPAVKPAERVNNQEVRSPDSIKDYLKAGVPVEFSTIPPWQGRDKCGLNCLYALLRLTSADVSYQRLEQVAGPVPSGGFSLAQLEEIAAQVGHPALSIKATPAEVLSMTPPVIIHLGDPGYSGHFICMATTIEDRRVFLDGTSGSQFVVGPKETRHSLTSLLRRASGYALIPAPAGQRTTAQNVRRVMYGAILITLAVSTVNYIRSCRPSRG